MTKVRKIFLVLLLFTMICCHHGARHCVQAAENAKFHILASTFPVYLFTKNIANDVPDVSVELLIPAAAGCPHDFSLRPADIAKLGRADVLIINGLGLEDFLEKTLKNVAPNLPVIDAAKNVPTIEADSDQHDHHDHGLINPHIFAAPKQAALMSRNIGAELARLDPAKANFYEENTDKYAHTLEALSNKLEEIGKKAKNPKIALVHDALAYLASNAGLDIISIFEDNQSAAQLRKLIALLADKQPALLAGDAQYPDKLLMTMAQETNLPFALLNPCASGPENATPDFYEKTMLENIKILDKYFE